MMLPVTLQIWGKRDSFKSCWRLWSLSLCEEKQKNAHNILSTILDSILKSRDITLPTKVRPVKAMGFPVVMYGCESWTVKFLFLYTADDNICSS